MSLDTFPLAMSEDMSSFEENEQRSGKRVLVVAGGLLAAVLLGAGGYFLLGGGGEELENSSFVPAVPRPAVAVPKAPAPAVKKLPTAYQEQLGRDPFKALYVAAPAAAPAAPAPPAEAPGTTGGTTGTSTGTGTTPTAPLATRYPLKLMSISQASDEARFTSWSVDGQKTTVLPAQRFGKHGELVVLAFSKNAQGVVDKAILQVGDDSPIEVAVGQTNSVL